MCAQVWVCVCNGENLSPPQSLRAHCIALSYSNALFNLTAALLSPTHKVVHDEACTDTTHIRAHMHVCAYTQVKVRACNHRDVWSLHITINLRRCR